MHGPNHLVWNLALCMATIGLVSVLVGCSAPSSVPLAYVAVGGGNHVRVIDLDTGETLRRLYTGASPWRLVPSPDGRRLWIQHWYAATTAVLDLQSHEIVATLPLRGPGAFSSDGASFLSFHWPGDELVTVDARSFERLDGRPTEVRQVYDLLSAHDGQTLYLVQYDPRAHGRGTRYGYLVVYPYRLPPDKAAPASLPTGVGPVGLTAVPGEPFVLSIDAGTNGLTLLNDQQDGRAVAVCPAPRDVAFNNRGATEATRMVVVCWRGEGARESQVMVFRTDFSARPWPTIERIAETTVPGGLSAAAFAAGGERLWVTDRTDGRLLELAVEPRGGEQGGEQSAAHAQAHDGGIEVVREIDTGPVPLDLVIRTVTPAERDRIARGKTRGRRLAEATLARMIESGSPFEDLSWTETAVAPEPDEGKDGEKQPAPPAASPPVRWELLPPDGLRVGGETGFRLARGGSSLTVDRFGRFWVAPRQELLGAVYSLPALSVEQAVRRLAGDVPDSPWLSAGLALDLAAEVEEEGMRSVLLGADRKGLRVAQLWVDVETARPAALIEQIPNFQPAGTGFHGGETPVELVETRFLGFARVGDRLWMPTSLERDVEGRPGLTYRLGDFALDAGRASGDGGERFDLTRLGGAEPDPGLFAGSATQENPSSDPPLSKGGMPPPGPGQAVPVLEAGSEPAGLALPGPRPPEALYPSNPPTSGPHLPYTEDWGVHDLPVPLPLQVHNLLDGGVALQWSCPRGCPELVGQLAAFAREHDQVLVAPYPWLPGDGEGPRLALTAWGRIARLDHFDRDRIEAFLDAWGGRDHHSEVEEGP